MTNIVHHICLSLTYNFFGTDFHLKVWYSLNQINQCSIAEDHSRELTSWKRIKERREYLQKDKAPPQKLTQLLLIYGVCSNPTIYCVMDFKATIIMCEESGAIKIRSRK